MDLRRPSTTWFWVAAAIALVGVVAAVAWGWQTYGLLEGRLDALPRAGVPGDVEVDVAEPQGLTVFYEDPTDAGGFLVQWRRLARPDSPVDVRVVGPSGDEVAVRAYVGELRLDVGDRVAVAIATFEAPVAGSYTVAVDGDAPAGARVSVGQVVDGGLVARAAGVLAVFVGSLVVAGGVVIVVAVKRARTRDQARREAGELVDA
jgi:hypothetical protein